MSNRVLLNCDKVYFSLSLKNNSESLISSFQNIYYLLNSFYNLVSLKLLNNGRIYYNNKFKILYYVELKKVLAKKRYLKNSNLLKY